MKIQIELKYQKAKGFWNEDKYRTGGDLKKELFVSMKKLLSC
jgi:hypothetical protein